jgi:hypothetical protein
MSVFMRWVLRRVAVPNRGRHAPRRGSRLRPQLEHFEDRWVPATGYLVTSLADSNTPGTLRFAITQANANNTGTAASPDQIRFATGGGTITVTGGPLPTLTDVAVLDATTATGYAGTPVITLDGALAGVRTGGLTVSAAASTVKGFDIVRFSGHGIRLDTGGGATVVSNYIGITTAGVVAVNGGSGVLISGTSGNTVGGTSAGDANVISGNGGDGIRIDGLTAANNLIVANFIGTDATGTLARGNTLDGVAVVNGAHDNLIGRSDSVTGVTYYDAAGVTLQPVTAWQGIRNSDTPGQYLLVGSSNDTGLLFDGTIAGVGTSYAVNYPGAVATSVYGPDNLNGTGVRLVGTYRNAGASTAPVKVNGFVFEGTTADLSDGSHYRTIDIPGAEFNYVHSTMGGLAVGNYDSAAAHGTFSLPLGPGHAFLYDVAAGTVLTDIAFPGSVSNTAYGIWYNGGTSYTVCGGWSPDPVNNFDDQNRAIGQGYLVDYDSATGRFTNWASFAYPNGTNFVTHFEGISSVEKGVYTLNADSVQGGSTNPVQGSWVSVRRNPDGSFGSTTWIDLNYPTTGTPALVSSSNSVYGNQVVGLAIGANSVSFQATVNVGFQLSNLISGNGGNGVGLYGASDNEVAMNYIGTDVTGTRDLGNAGNGVLVTAGAARNRIGGQATGGNDPTAGTFVRPPQGNLISGNDANGVLVDGLATLNVLSGNFIGTSASGVSPLGNANRNQLVGCTFRQDPFVFYNVLGGNGGNGLRIADSNDTTVQADFFGMGSDNTTAVGNARDGVLIEGSSAGTQFGGVIPLGNVVVANGENGVEIRGTASGTVAFNTFDGLPAFKVTAVGNGLDGFLITSTGGNNQLRTNVIAGNLGNGIHISGDATGVEVTEDIIGLDTNGQLPLPNGANGILIDGTAHGNTVGGLQPSVILQTTISANGGHGVAILGDAHDNRVIHSFVGTNITGVTPYGNAGAGIFVGGTAHGNTVGGVGSGDENLVSGNLGDGILLGGNSTGTVVVGNRIGANRTGLTGLPNQGSGISIFGSDNRIGGTAAGEGNVIAFNTLAGVGVATGTGNRVLGNSIFGNGGSGNGGSGIDLTAGGNRNQPSPGLTAADLPTAAAIQVNGTLAAAANTTYRIEFFASSNDTPPGQGQTPLGSLTATTDATGLARFTFRAARPVGSGASITATATDPAGNTSEFSAPVTARAAILAVGADAGGAPQVSVFNPDGSLRFTFLAFDARFAGGVRVAVGHIGGRPVIVAAAGPGGGPNVRVFDATGRQVPGALGSFFAYDAAFTGGVFVAVGDVDGDGDDDLITGAGAGGGPQVNVFSGRDGRVLQSFFAYDAGFRGGVSVAAGFVNGDTHADIITGAGAGGGPQVKVFDGANPGVLLSSFFAFDAGFRGGVYVAAGNLRGGATDLVVVGAGAGGGPQVNIYDRSAAGPLASFFAYDDDFRGGARVGVLDGDGDGQDDIITGAGPGGGPQVNIGSSATRQVVDSFFAFDPTFHGGVFVGGG